MSTTVTGSIGVKYNRPTSEDLDNKGGFIYQNRTKKSPGLVSAVFSCESFYRAKVASELGIPALKLILPLVNKELAVGRENHQFLGFLVNLMMEINGYTRLKARSMGMDGWTKAACYERRKVC